MTLLARLSRISILRFAVIGALGMPVDAGALWLMLNPGQSPYTLARPVAWFCAATFTWIGNRYFTFADTRAHGLSGTVSEWGRFLLANGVGGVVNVGASIALKHFGPEPLNNPYIALVCGVLLGLVFNFVLSKKMVFRRDVAADTFKGPI